MTEPAPTDRWLAAAIVAANFGPPFLFSGVAVALPAMGRDLAASATELGLVETTFLCSSLALLLPVGRLADASDMREKVAAQYPGSNRWDLKYARGGMVDIEFLAQTLQLVHAHHHP